jgi:hypothetical protein
MPLTENDASIDDLGVPLENQLCEDKSWGIFSIEINLPYHVHGTV